MGTVVNPYISFPPAAGVGPLSTRNVVAFTETAANQTDLVKTDSYTVGAGTELLLGFFAGQESSTLLTGGLGLVASATHNAEALALGQRFGGAGAGKNDVCSEIWRRASPTAGAHDLVTTWDAQTDATAYIAVEVIGGVDLASPIGATATAEGTVGPVSVTITTTVANSLIVAIATCRVGGTVDSDPFTPTSGSELADGQTGSIANSDLSYWVAELLTTAPGDYTISASLNANNNWTMAAVEIKPAV